MAEERAQRHLAAILAADVVGYARLMEQDEADTFARLRAHRKDLFEPEIEEHHGRVFKLMGDGLLAEFGSVVDAVECAVALQRGMAERNNGVPEDRRIDVRIGVNLGDVIVEGEDRHGEGVNIAARLQELAEPGGICISQQAFDQVETKLDLIYEDLGEHLVKNIVKAIHVYRVAGEGARAARRFPKMRRPKLGAIAGGLVALLAIGGAIGWYWTREDPVLALPSGPSIAILPFSNMSDDPDDAYFSNGLTEDIITALSKFSDLRVIARNSTFQFKGNDVDVQEVASKLGAHYVVEGSVKRSQDHLRVTAQLLDASDGTHLWSETYDRDLTAADIYAVQDEITERLAGSLGSSEAPLWKSEMRDLRVKRTESLEAYECVLLVPLFYETFKEHVHAQARDCLERAVKLAPNYARAWSALAWMYIEEYKYAYNLMPEPLERALAAAQRAVELDNRNQDGYYALAIINYLRGEDLNSFYALAEQAIALNPNNATVIADLGLWMAYSGDWERGMPLVRKAVILNPLHPRWIFFAFFLDHYRKGEYREALTEGLKINLPKNPGVQTGLLAVYGQLGETEKARAKLAEIRANHPGVVGDPRAWFVKRRVPDELVESLMDGLRKAGLDVPPADPS
jgi:TolB-like protein/class 3 adenylate cyclase/Flp pilus assembly protein TadD